MLVSHSLFDWSCRRSKTGLVNNLGDIVKENFGLVPDLSVSSPLFKGAEKVYKLAAKKKNVNKSKETLIKCEEKALKAFQIDLGGVIVKDDEAIRGSKRKNFDELTSRNKKIARVKNQLKEAHKFFSKTALNFLSFEQIYLFRIQNVYFN